MHQQAITVFGVFVMKTVLALISGVFGFVLFRMLGDTSEARLAVAFGLLVTIVPCGIIGFIAAKVLSKRIEPDGDFADIASWTSLVLWLFPPFGIIAGTVIYEWSEHSKLRNLRFQILAAFCILVSVANAAYGARNAAASSIERQLATQVVKR
jgi:hypothetical protein